MAVKLPDGVIPEPLPWRSTSVPAARPAYVPPPPASGEEPKGKFGKLLAAKKQENVQGPPAAAAPAAGGGKMLAFLQKKRDQSMIEGPLPQVLEKVADELRAHARTKGFKNFAEILLLKKEKVEREFEKHEKGGALTDGGREAFHKELLDIDRVTKIPPAQAVQDDPLLKELSAMVREGQGGLNRELSGLMDELS